MSKLERVFKHKSIHNPEIESSTEYTAEPSDSTRFRGVTCRRQDGEDSPASSAEAALLAAAAGCAATWAAAHQRQVQPRRTSQ